VFRCPELEEKTGGKRGFKKKFTGKCETCNKTGHKAEACWKDPKNADKVPGWLKKKNEKNAGGETGLAGVKVLLTLQTVESDDVNEDG
jgi:hypothetical protein